MVISKSYVTEHTHTFLFQISVMAVFKQILLAIAMQISIHASAGTFLACPQECSCSSGNVTCSDMTSFPVNFPDDTREITITNMDVDALPVDAFSELPFLESIKIYSSKIRRIRSCTFDSLSDIEEIVFSGLHIGLIDSFAFQNLTDVGSITFKFSSIGVIKSHAFTKFFAFDEISFYFVNATTIESLAFYDIDELFELRLEGVKVKKMNRYALANITNVIDLVLKYNTIDELFFPNFDRMLVESYRDWLIGNRIPCTCDLVKVLKDVHLKRILTSNWCLLNTEERRADITWKELNEDLLDCRDSDRVLTGKEDCYENLPEDMKSGLPKNENIVTDKTRMDCYHHDQPQNTAKLEISTENEREKGENMTTDAAMEEKRGDVAVNPVNVIEKTSSLQVTKVSRPRPRSVSNAAGEDSGIYSVSDRGRPYEKSPGSVAALQEQHVMSNAGDIRAGMTFVCLCLLALVGLK